MVLRLISCSPRSGRARCHRRRRNCFHQLDASIGASGPHDFTVRIRTIRQRRIRVHRIPSRACDDRETPLVPGRDEIDVLLIWVRRQVNFGKSEIDRSPRWHGVNSDCLTRRSPRRDFRGSNQSSAGLTCVMAAPGIASSPPTINFGSCGRQEQHARNRVVRGLRPPARYFRSSPVNGRSQASEHVSKVPNADIELTGSRHQFNDPLRVVSAGDAKLTLRGG